MKLRNILFLLLIVSANLIYALPADSIDVQPNDTTELSSDKLVLNILKEQGIPITVNNKIKLLKSG